MDNPNSDDGLESLASFCHGALGALHTLGIVYSIQREKWWNASFHSLCAGFDAYSAYEHYKEANDENHVDST